MFELSLWFVTVLNIVWGEGTVEANGSVVSILD
jgi:hypothetical protein